ncbi:MAG: prolyl oligopeptidase family serine peptidase [Acidobacteriota bacterium]
MRNKRFLLLFILIFSLIFINNSFAKGKRVLSFTDIMKFKEIKNLTISEDGLWVALNADPDRGNGEVHIYSTSKDTRYIIKRGSKPVISKDGKWTVMAIKPGKTEKINAKKKKLKPGMALLNNKTGEKITKKNITKFSFTPDSRFLIYLENKKKIEEKTKVKDDPEKTSQNKKKEEKDKINTNLVVMDLADKKEKIYERVSGFSIDKENPFLVFIQGTENKDKKILNFLDLRQNIFNEKKLLETAGGDFLKFSWSKTESMLAFILTPGKGKEIITSSLYILNGKNLKLEKALGEENISPGWIIPGESKITWSEDNKRIFSGFKPKKEAEFYRLKKEKTEKITDEQYFNPENILKKSGVDVWHWNDPLINPQQKVMWKKNKKRAYLWVFHLNSKKLVPLAGPDMETLLFNKNPDYGIGMASKPWLKKLTWDGSYKDVFLVNLKNGKRKKILEEYDGWKVHLSPSGKYIVYYKEKDWFIYNIKKGTITNLTTDIKTPFYDEDNDYPSPPSGYGTGGWLKNDSGIFIYDKYDIWIFSVNNKKPSRITMGREKNTTYRIIHTDPEKTFYNTRESILISAYSHDSKNTHFSFLTPGKPEIKKISGGNNVFRFKVRSKNGKKLLYTRENFNEFPDLWITNPEFTSQKKLTNINPQISDFKWGRSELVKWQSADGIPLHGVLITPEGYNRDKKLPVLVYYYRFFSQRLNRFNQMKINHRPNFPFYASNDYAVFLPDIRFEIGRPGFSATKCLVPGIQKLIDMGIADPKAICLHGHSWSGYQTAHVITQTNIFTCAIAGAPVSNMTSAYSGIRWKSGMARQFQYEKSQSRIGVSMWENLTPYIENSPVFFADRINTPLLIQFGDKDGAVPWYQGIELYLALRRLGKECIFLQYRGEPHHLQQYPNKLDYSIKFKEYLDHYLKGKEAPEWIRKGVQYRKK